MGIPNLRSIALAALAAIGLSGCDPAPKAVGRMLVSIVGVHLENNEGLYTASVEFENLRVRAICHIPAGWTMAAGNPSRRSLIVEGKASSRAYELHNDELKALKGLLLVESWTEGRNIGDRSDYKIRAVLYANVWSEPPDGAIYELDTSHIVVEPADRCPAPME